MTEFIFGSMRMSQKSHSIQYWVNLFKYMHDRGIIQHHVSIEYESFELYVSVFQVFKTEYPNYNIKHICKIGEPSFNDKKFSRNRLIEKCKEYCIKLNVNTINIQWMSRLFLTDQVQRRRHLLEISHEISETIKEDNDPVLCEVSTQYNRPVFTTDLRIFSIA